MKNGNDNRTYIYRIRRKYDGAFLTSNPMPLPGSHDDCSFLWGPIGCFWKKPATIRAHLLELCKFRIYEYSNVENHKPFDLRRRHRGKRQQLTDAVNPFFHITGWDTPHRLVRIVYEWLDKYEVIATEISVHGENVMEAKDFASFLPSETEAA